MKIEMNEKFAIKITVISVCLNLCLAVIKLCGGIFGNSYAVVSDGVNSATDVFYSLIVIIGLKISMRKPDKNHPFGHERFECVAAILLSFILFLTGIGIGYTGISNIVTGAYKTFAPPSITALIVTAISVLAKTGMFAYTYVTAKKLNSASLKADAFNHISDVFSSVGVIIGLIGAMCGVLILDSIACLIISALILKAAVEVFIEAVKKMTDEACDAQTEAKIVEIIKNNQGVMSVDMLLTRKFANRIYVITEIACEKELSLEQAHLIAENVHASVENNFPLVKHVTVHVNPYEK